MVQANVAAAEFFSRPARCRSSIVSMPIPSPEKIKSPRRVPQDRRDQPCRRAKRMQPRHFNQILTEARATPTAELVSEVILRSQAQAEYAPGNFGHFGLNLRRYAHFTSPIRRYADLIVHRALISALGLGNDGLTDAEISA